eukprot:CAMPEP_0172813774 /NCGR_PEP_ID=MMETSP1075-20121228/10861_1 /TAXON_ID=2916 /ORGANISM="Ceratium fusus, Strain PA161109" /LENGTH=187 /DNA_ID=CAMNT_0013653507 /DNA_START=58 /DNA_END=621 /DNA_ORIENTATION=+
MRLVPEVTIDRHDARHEAPKPEEPREGLTSCPPQMQLVRVTPDDCQNDINENVLPVPQRIPEATIDRHHSRPEALKPEEPQEGFTAWPLQMHFLPATPGNRQNNVNYNMLPVPLTETTFVAPDEQRNIWRWGVEGVYVFFALVFIAIASVVVLDSIGVFDSGRSSRSSSSSSSVARIITPSNSTKMY